MLLLVGGLAAGYVAIVFRSARKTWAEMHERQGCHMQPVDEVRHEDMPPMGGLFRAQADRDLEAAALALLAHWDCRARLDSAVDDLREALAAIADLREVARQLEEPWDDPARTAQRAGR